jgi:hypothetical protein
LPYRSTPVPQTWPSIARRKRLAAERREADAARLRAEALEYDRKWRQYLEDERPKQEAS